MTAVARRQLSSNSGRPVAWRTLTARAGHVGQDVGDDGGCLGWQDKSAWEKTQRWERENGSDSSLVRILDCKKTQTPRVQEKSRYLVFLSIHFTSPDVCRKVHAAQAKDRSSVSAVNTSSTALAVTTYEIPPQYHLPHPCSALSSLVIFHSLTLRSFPD